MADDALVVFTPSGRRGHFALGTPILTAARNLGVDIDSVCGGRGICGRCQIKLGEGEFAKHGITSRAEHLSEFNEVEAHYDRLKGMRAGRRLSCQAVLQGDVVIDVPPDSQVHKQVVRKRPEARAIELDPARAAMLGEFADRKGYLAAAADAASAADRIDVDAEAACGAQDRRAQRETSAPPRRGENDQGIARTTCAVCHLAIPGGPRPSTGSR